MHERVCAAAAETAASENVSQALCGLAESAHDQSGAFVFDYGLPQDRPVMKGVDAVLMHGAMTAEAALVDSTRRPDV